MKKKKNRRVVLKASEENIKKFESEQESEQEREQEREQNRYLFGKFIEWSTWILFLLIISAIIGPLFNVGPFKGVTYKEFFFKSLNNSLNLIKQNIPQILLVIFIFYLIYLVVKFLKTKWIKYRNSVSLLNKKSFKSLLDHYQDGNFSRVLYQTLLTLPFYYYIKIKSGDPFLFFNFSSSIDNADVSFWLLLFPFLVCYYLIKIEFLDTKFDYNQDLYVNQAAASERYGIRYGIYYAILGYVGAALIDFSLSFLYHFIPIAIRIFDF